MRSLLIQMNEATFLSLKRAARAAKLQPNNFVRAAIRKAIRETEEERMKLAYTKQPDTDVAGDDWSNAEKWNA
jgi:hypothetical protein